MSEMKKLNRQQMQRNENILIQRKNNNIYTNKKECV